MGNERLLQEVNEILGNISSAVRSERCTFYLFNRERDSLESMAALGVKNIIISVPVGKGIVGTMFKNEKPLIVNNVQESSLFDNVYDSQLKFTTKSTICVPVFNEKGRPIGAIQCLNKIDGIFDNDDLEILNGFAATIFLIVKNKELYYASEQIKNNFSTLLEVFAAVSSELDLDNLIQLIMNKAAEITQADRSSLFFIDDETGELWTVYAKGLEKQIVRTNKGIVAEVAKNKEALIVNDPYNYPAFNPKIDIKTGYKTKSILSVPVFNSKNEILGVIQVINKIEGDFNSKDLSILNGFASQISIAIENAQLFDEIHNMKNYLSILIQNLDNGIVTVDKSYKVKTVNNVFYEMLGLNPNDEDISNKQISELDIKFNELFKYCHQTILTGEKQYQDEIEIKTRGNKNKVLNLSVLPMEDTHGNVIGAINVFNDITREKRIRLNLSRYIPHHLVNEVINKDGLSMLKGKYGKCSVLFSDIRNFTTLTEELGAIQIVELLNKYFGAMISSIYKHNGILDKFIGDAIMAVFGVPYTNKADAINAVKCALDMFDMLDKLNHENDASPLLNIGIGIGTGNVVSGNIGSEKRFEYTVIGNPVNLAARLESATKIYRVNILICEATYNHIGAEFHCRELDTLLVRGKQKPVKIYTITSHKKQLLSKNDIEFNKCFANGLKCFRKKQIEKAQNYFKKASIFKPTDGPTILFLKRCKEVLHTNYF